jgi:hypothetical protein
MTVAPTTAGRLGVYDPPAEIAGLRRRALVAGVAGLAVAGVGALLDLAHFLRSYLVAYLFWIGIALGCYALAMLHQLSGGAWGLMVRRVLGAASRTLPFMLVLFLPIGLGARWLYPWADPATVQGDPLLEHKAAYLNLPFFWARTLVYFGLWIGFAWLLNRWSLLSDRSTDHRPIRQLQVWSSLGLAVFVLGTTFATFDWLMSLDPHWFSSIYGLYFIASSAVGALSFVVLIGLWLSQRPPLQGLLAPRHFHDYGKLLLAFVMLWAYFQFSQFLIIWSGNLPEETGWYAQRVGGGWGVLALALVLLHFALPFLLLLSRDLKRSARQLATVGLLLLGARFLDLVWQAWPSAGHGASGGAAGASAGHLSPLLLAWVDVAALVGIGGLWLFVFFGQLLERQLLPVNDPALEEALGEA